MKELKETKETKEQKVETKEQNQPKEPKEVKDNPDIKALHDVIAAMQQRLDQHEQQIKQLTLLRMCSVCKQKGIF